VFSKEYFQHYTANIRLAYPVIIGQGGHMAAQIADSVMVGQVSALHLAASSFANIIFILFMLMGIGISTGITPLVGEALGSDNSKQCRNLLKHGLIINGFSAAILSAIMLYGIRFLTNFGQDPEVVRLAIPYLQYLIFSLVPYLLFSTYKQFADGFELTKIGMNILIIGNLINIALNYVFIYGHFGFPAMNLTGAGLATFLSRVYMLFHIWFALRNHPRMAQYVAHYNYRRYSLPIIKRIFSIGIPIGLQYVVEVGSFAAGAVLIGQAGSNQLAAHQIVISIASLTYLMASGIASAATIRISGFFGKKDIHSLQMAGNSSFIMSAAFMLISAVLLIVGKSVIPTFYVNDHEVIEIASNLFIIAALFQVFDGIQVVGLGALRGIQDVKYPTFIATVSYWIIALPVSYYFGVEQKMQALGVWYGYLAGLAVAAGMLVYRFNNRIGKLKQTYAGKE